MNNDPHTIVVGGGIVGVCSAYFLARRGQRVTLLEKDRDTTSASAGNAGIVALGHLPLPRPGLARRVLRWMLDSSSPLYIPLRFDPGLVRWLWLFQRACNAPQVAHCMKTLAQLGQETIHCWEEILSREHIDCAWQRSGWHDVYCTEGGRVHAIRDAEIVAEFGFEVQPLTGDELRHKDNAFGDGVQGAFHYPESAFLDPDRFLAGLTERLPPLGVDVRLGSEVSRFLETDGRCRGLELVQGERIEADSVVLAAGAWSTRLAAKLGVYLALQPAKGYHLDLFAPEPCPRTACVLTEAFVAVSPMPGKLRLAGTLEFSGLNHDLSPKRLDMLRIGAASCIPSVARADIASRWCGLRPCTADGLPVVGWIPGISGLFVATGHAKMGLCLGPITGRLVSECILDGQPSLDIDPMRVDRF